MLDIINAGSQNHRIRLRYSQPVRGHWLALDAVWWETITWVSKLYFGTLTLRERLSSILAPYRGQKGATIPVLQKVQEELGYLSEEAISEIATFLGLSKNDVYGVASFYAQFRFERQGEHAIRVCQGTACHVRGGRRILEAVEQKLGIH